MLNITELPEDCLSQILSLTSPRDVLRSSVVSRQFFSASVSDTVWDKFVPSDCRKILSRSSSSIPDNQIASKKDLFTYLTHSPLLLDNSTKSFALDKLNGKISYMLGARALSIAWGNDSQYWSWESIPESRFPECAVLNAVCWLDIKGKISATLLSPRTTYGIYFVCKIEDDTYTGFGFRPVKVSMLELVEDGLSEECHHTAGIKQLYLEEPDFSELEWMGVMGRTSPEELPVVRGDGWDEVEMGRYQVGVDGKLDGVTLEMAFKEVETLHWNGLVVHGIELRPLS